MEKLALTEFADKMNEIMPVIMKEFGRRQVNELYKGNITFPQFIILEFLFRGSDKKMTELAKMMKVTTAATTGIVDRMVRDGYIERIYDPKDRRVIKVKLTDKGNHLVKRINHQRRQMLFKIFGKLSEKDRQDHLRILMQIKEILLEGKKV